MHAFVVLVAKPGRPIPPEIERRLRHDRPDLLFEPQGDRCWSNPSGTVILRGWEQPNPALGIDTHWEATEEGVTAFRGTVWRRDGWRSGRSYASQLAERCQSRAADEVAEDVSGLFTMINLDRDGVGWVLNDALGLSLIYSAETSDYFVYATRANVAAWLTATESAAPSRDDLGVAWLAYSGHLVGDRTGFTDVRVVPVGHRVEIGPAFGGRQRPWPCAPWNVAREPGRADELADAVGDEIGDFVDVISGLPAPEKVVGLTGGKDSRLILARLLERGLEDTFTYLTLGDKNLPDVAVAREIAESFGLEHRWGRAGTPSTTPYDERIRSFVHRTSGMLNIWDARPPTADPDTLNVSGMGGETLRTNFPATNDMASIDRLEQRVERGWPHPPGSLVRPDALAEMRRRTRDEMFDPDLGHQSAQDLIHVFYLRNRLRSRGIEAEVDPTNRLFPLYSLAGLRAAFAIGAEKRCTEYIHYRLIDSVSPDLAKRRFAGETWYGDQATTPRSEPADRPAKAAPARSGQTAKQRSQARSLPERKAVLHAVLADDPSNPVFEVIDRAAVVDALDRIEELRPREQSQLFGAATAAIWLGRTETVSEPAVAP